MTELQINKYLKNLERKLLSTKRWQRIQLNRVWTKKFPTDAGVYVIRESGQICYVGEAGSIRARMTDLLETRNHVVRRSIGNKKYKDNLGFEKATSHKKFSPEIETKLNRWIKRNLEIATITVALGRKELEEYIYDKYDKPKYNNKGKRK